MFLFILSLILLAPLFVLELIITIFSADELRDMGISLERTQIESTYQ